MPPGLPRRDASAETTPMSPDYRLPENRRSVFHDFYEFHLRYGAHPGCVYYLMPYLRKRYEWTTEQALWFAFLNGNTQNPVTSLMLHRRGSTPSHAFQMLDWFKENYGALAFDTDRRYHKKALQKACVSYLNATVRLGQARYWKQQAERGFAAVWNAATSIETFGRLSAFSYAEYLRVMGLDFDCDDLMIRDIPGSRSHRNGLCIVLGLDEYDWHRSNPDFDGKYPPSLLQRLEHEGALLLAEARERAAGQPWERDVSYFTLESTLCTYKGWHRPNRRYPNVYNDMLYDRIAAAQDAFPREDLEVFWEAREACLPAHLLLEEEPHDPGLHPLKQNHYRLTGQVVMMDVEYPWYRNDFNDAVRCELTPLRNR